MAVSSFSEYIYTKKVLASQYNGPAYLEPDERFDFTSVPSEVHFTYLNGKYLPRVSVGENHLGYLERSWQNISPGDWIVYDNGVKVYSDKEFHKLFRKE